MSSPITAEVSRLRTVEPPEDAAPSPREPVSARAMIASTAEARLREIPGEIRATVAKLQRLLNEHAQLKAHQELAGVVSEDAAE